jgi:hypothetical protein
MFIQIMSTSRNNIKKVKVVHSQNIPWTTLNSSLNLMMNLCENDFLPAARSDFSSLNNKKKKKVLSFCIYKTLDIAKRIIRETLEDVYNQRISS